MNTFSKRTEIDLRSIQLRSICVNGPLQWILVWMAPYLWNQKSHFVQNEYRFIACRTYIAVGRNSEKCRTSLFHTHANIIYKSKYKKVGVLPIRIVYCNVSSIGPSSERTFSNIHVHCTTHDVELNEHWMPIYAYCWHRLPPFRLIFREFGWLSCLSTSPGFVKPMVRFPL